MLDFVIEKIMQYPLSLVPVNQSCDRRGVDFRQPAANLVRYNVQASPLQQRGVPVIVPHLQEPSMGSRTKEGQYLHKYKLPVSIVQHSAKREKARQNQLPPLLQCIVLNGSPRSSAPACGVASSYKK